jgi:predicted RecA/RadA family phage recombinase
MSYARQLLDTYPDSTDDLIVSGDLVRVGCRLGLEWAETDAGEGGDASVSPGLCPLESLG